MEIILTESIFEFHNQLWKQKIGAAIGSRPVPHYANNFMADIDKEIKVLAAQYDKNNTEALRLLKRFLDDYFSLFVGSTRELHHLLDAINKINPSIQLTLNHTSNINETPEERCDCKFKTAIPFLDTLVSLKEGKIEIDLYKKETDRDQYLLPSSCHNKTVTNSISLSLSLRIVRICTNPEDRETRFKELKKNTYYKGLTKKSQLTIQSIRLGLPRKKALKKVNKNN